MEQGLLPAAGVSDSVLEALGRIVGLRRRRAAQGGRDARRRARRRATGGGGVRSDGSAARGGGRARCGRPPPSPRNGTRSIASSADAIERQLGARRPTSYPMNDLLRLYRYALRVGDRPLAELLARVTRGDPAASRARRPGAPGRCRAARRAGRREPSERSAGCSSGSALFGTDRVRSRAMQSADRAARRARAERATGLDLGREDACRCRWSTSPTRGSACTCATWRICASAPGVPPLPPDAVAVGTAAARRPARSG